MGCNGKQRHSLVYENALQWLAWVLHSAAPHHHSAPNKQKEPADPHEGTQNFNRMKEPTSGLL
jgi:hypothetical protein